MFDLPINQIKIDGIKPSILILGHDRDLLIEMLNDPKEIGLIKRKIEKIRGLI